VTVFDGPMPEARFHIQNDNHLPQLSVRQTLDFAARCQGPAFGNPPLPSRIPFVPSAYDFALYSAQKAHFSTEVIF
jgi:hypothetical protein